jgi:hypothetical protein
MRHRALSPEIQAAETGRPSLPELRQEAACLPGGRQLGHGRGPEEVERGRSSGNPERLKSRRQLRRSRFTSALSLRSRAAFSRATSAAS